MTETRTLGPRAPAGDHGRWVNLGEVGVDSGHLAIVDPCFTHVPEADRIRNLGEALSHEYGTMGVRFGSGLGDGGYDVWAWVVDDPDGYPGGRIAQIVVTLIDDERLREWNEDE